MPKNKTLGSLALSGYDDIFGNNASDTTNEHITLIPLADLHPPEFHPFQVLDDDAMTRLVNSVKLYGVREPGLARPRQDGAGASSAGYELLAGNRRRRACELAGIATMPVIVRNLDDDSAAILMVDSNLEQREKLLFSERAWAYRVKMEALNHRSIKADMLSVEVLVEQTGESKNQIFRLIRLTELINDLLDKVDTKQLAFNPAVELSYLSISEQTAVAEAMAAHEVKPSLSQAQRLKKLKQSGDLTTDTIDAVLSEEKRVTDPRRRQSEQALSEKYRKFFPSDYTPRQMDKVITDLLSVWQSQQAQP